MVQTARRQKTLICMKNQQAQATRWSAPFLPLPRTVHYRFRLEICLASLIGGLFLLRPVPTLAQVTQPKEVVCASLVGQRAECPVNTTAGVALIKSTGPAACLLGRTWGYDNRNIWVSGGCAATFVLG